MTHPELSDIIVYPVKSASEISLKNSNLEQRGLAHDRRWMVVDDSAQFITQRTSPEMALLKTEIFDSTLIVKCARDGRIKTALISNTRNTTNG